MKICANAFNEKQQCIQIDIECIIGSVSNKKMKRYLYRISSNFEISECYYYHTVKQFETNNISYLFRTCDGKDWIERAASTKNF